ncbi:hypothetical protein EKE94_14230 [Mesobaculum littorinae]|uniref:Uncharacterized protein n=1 Tax=Mesobaculum littorinae TaxID=2486419 RepID=A0A438AEQ0_9RHOB|nr:hypothetical protein [Mesobaculum littorinae]RVV97181.1 hypothetical protein EKE94_14230 [Mesobaculum littorinae]
MAKLLKRTNRMVPPASRCLTLTARSRHSPVGSSPQRALTEPDVREARSISTARMAAWRTNLPLVPLLSSIGKRRERPLSPAAKAELSFATESGRELRYPEQHQILSGLMAATIPFIGAAIHILCRDRPALEISAH